MNHHTSTVPQVILQVAYQSPQAPTQLMTKPPFVDSGFVVPLFSPRDDLIACINKAMAFLTAVASSRATLRVQGEILQVDRQELLNAKTAKKAMLAGAQKAGQILDEEQLAFLADPGIPAGQAQTIIPHNAAFQTQDLNTYDSDCDDLSNAQAVLMANISNYGSDVISELERYKERVKTFEQRLNIDLSSHEKMIDSEMDDMIKEKLALKEKNAPRIKPTLYDGIVISEKHVAMHVIDDEETLILEEESRSKMSEKAKDPEVLAKKISHKPIDYEKLNRLTNDFGKRFTPQQEFSTEQAFWLRISNPTIESSLLPVRVEVPTQLKDKDTTICKLNDTIKSLRKNNKEEIVDHDRCDLATINEELENGVAKLLSKNKRLHNVDCKEINHVKQVFRDQFDSIKQTCVLQWNIMTL
nr:hypothetical protein [Tanacetum cinerariifolium]